MKRKSLIALAAALALTALLGAVVFAAERDGLITAGEQAPELKFQAALDAQGKKYLGLSGDAATFGLADVKADVLVLEMFGLYCLHCRAEAPKVKTAFELLDKDGLADKVKFLGVGVKNTAFEVQAFRTQLKVPFPGAPDPDMAVTKNLGIMATPTFVVLKLENGGGKVLFTQVGDIGDPAAFVQKIKTAAAL